MITTGAKLLENKPGNEEIRRKEGGHTRGARGGRGMRGESEIKEEISVTRFSP
jgi:hypothetical protein